jgi:hypothetical protein
MRMLRSAAVLGVALGIQQLGPALADTGRSFDRVSFYFAAHEDDWQLFMNPSAFEDVSNANTKTVFIHMTAGDDGLGTGTGGRKHPFYLARENGADAAIRFMANSDYQPPAEESVEDVEVKGHRLHRVSYRNAVAYYFRVPDGNGTGAGYPSTGFQSLKRLADGQIRTLAAIDSSTVYGGWSDLVSTLRAVLDLERGRAPAVQLNVAELDPVRNPGDHSDHILTARAALDAAKDLTCARRLHYVEYASSHLPENLDARARDMESSVFAVTVAAVSAFDHSTAWHRYDQNYVGRSYFRVEEGTGRCDAAFAAAAHPSAAYAIRAGIQDVSGK